VVFKVDVVELLMVKIKVAVWVQPDALVVVVEYVPLAVYVCPLIDQ
jgi:hypothetical protein